MAGPVRDDPGRSDEELFLGYSRELAEGIERHLCDWVVRSVRTRCASAGIDFDEAIFLRARDAGERCRSVVGPLIADLLGADIDEQRTTPLVILRDATAYATQVLVEAGVPPVDRDEFEVRAFPDDLYALSPASIDALDESLAEVALVWGAAKAHIHLKRHRPS